MGLNAYTEQTGSTETKKMAIGGSAKTREE